MDEIYGCVGNRGWLMKAPFLKVWTERKESPETLQGGNGCIVLGDLHGGGRLAGTEFVARSHSQPTSNLQQRN